MLLNQVTSLLARPEVGLWVDATLGDGGHAEALLEATAPHGRLLGLDWDPSAIERARRRLRKYGERVIIVCANYTELARYVPAEPPLKGIILDAGVSSAQLSNPGRGFSFQSDGPLDMRMAAHTGPSAEELVNRLSARQLADLLHRYGEERLARRIARAIVHERRGNPITTTARLARVIASARPSRPSKSKARVFQALRVAVNSELDNLRQFLTAAPDMLVAGSRMAVISYHSLEDRLVKQAFRHWAARCTCPPNTPRCTCGGAPRARLLTRKPVRPDPDEVSRNPRSRSARLRAVEWLGGSP